MSIVNEFLKTFRRQEDGSVLTMFAMSIVVIFLVVALVIDIGLVRMTGNRLQITADAAAMAGAQELPSQTAVNALALSYTEKNYPAQEGGTVLAANDIQIGHWTGTAFIAGGTPVDAVQVTTRRDGVNANPLQSLFAGFGNIDSFEISRTAVAHVGIRPICEAGGFFSNSNVESGSNNGYQSDFCLYGRLGVKISSDNTFGPGAVIGMNDIGNFEQGGNNVGVDGALTEMNEALVAPSLVPGVIAGMRTSIDNLPGFIDGTVVQLNEITDTTPLTAGNVYVVNEVADLGSNRQIQDIGIVANKEIKVGSNNILENVVFATPDKILIGSNNDIGGLTPCVGGDYNTYLFSESNIEFGSNNNIGATQMSSGDEIKLGSDVATVQNVYAEALGNIDYGSADNFGACPGGLESSFSQIVITAGTGNLTLVH